MEDSTAVKELLNLVTQSPEVSHENVFVIPQRWIPPIQNLDNYHMGSTSSGEGGNLYFNTANTVQREKHAHQDLQSDGNHDKSLQCNTCQKMFKSLATLRKHIRQKHNNSFEQIDLEKYKHLCGKCGKIYTLKAQLIEHDEAVHLKKLLKCQFCKRTYKWKSGLHHHLKTHPEFRKSFKIKSKSKGKRKRMPKSNWKCKQCSLEFISKKLFDTHRQEIHGCKFKCKYCKKQFGLYSMYNQHVRSDHGDLINTFECDVCQRSYTAEWGLKSHMEQEGHSPTVQMKDANGVTKFGYKCIICETEDTVFETNMLFRNHLQIAHPAQTGEAQNFNGAKKCLYCSKTFKDITLYREHKKTHAGKKERKCDRCDYKCVYPSDLRKHIATHTGERGYKCTFCGKCFPSISSQRFHERRHTKDYRHRCVKCQKGFYSRGALANHLPIHNQEWEFECNLCKKRYQTEDSLRRHMRIKHCNDTQYNCITCHEVFSTEELFKEHSQVHRNDFICVVCRKGFINKEDLEDHESLVHVKDSLQRLKAEYVCTLCSTKCESVISFALHCAQHLETGPFHCVKCKLRLTVRKSFAKHMEAKHTAEFGMISEEVQQEVAAKLELVKTVAFKMLKTDEVLEASTTKSRRKSTVFKPSKTSPQKSFSKLIQKTAKSVQEATKLVQDDDELNKLMEDMQSGSDESETDDSKPEASPDTAKTKKKMPKSRKYECRFCARSYDTDKVLKIHHAKSHQPDLDLYWQCLTLKVE